MKKAYFASGCFWGTQYYFQRAFGVVQTQVGYMGGYLKNPSYQDVCYKNTGHLEAIEIEYDPKLTSYEDLVKLFFETHDFTQRDGQGPDIGPQYLSCIFYVNEEEKETALRLLDILRAKGYKPATLLKPYSHFWVAESYHQHYYDKNGSTPYCHRKVSIF